MQTRVASADDRDPVVQGWQSVLASKFANPQIVHKAVPIVRRLGHKQDDPPVWERDAAMVSYTLALEWAIGKDAGARDKAIEIMDAWSDVFRDHAGDENTYSGLQLGHARLVRGGGADPVRQGGRPHGRLGRPTGSSGSVR